MELRDWWDDDDVRPVLVIPVESAAQRLARHSWLVRADQVLDSIEHHNEVLGATRTLPAPLSRVCHTLGVPRRVLHSGAAMHDALLDAMAAHLIPVRTYPAGRYRAASSTSGGTSAQLLRASGDTR